jgi:hypothetical protein
MESIDCACLCMSCLRTRAAAEAKMNKETNANITETFQKQPHQARREAAATKREQGIAHTG